MGRRDDLINSIQSFNAGREGERLQLKYQKMAGGAYAFLRGSCHRFYQQLPRGGVFKSAPPVWACGDLHLENFGSYKGDNRLVYFDINDFDEALVAPASWDLVRLISSLWVATQELGLRAAEAHRLSGLFLAAYAKAMAGGKAAWVERETAQGPVRALLDSLQQRRRPQWLDGRTRRSGSQRRLLIDGKKALAASESERADVTHFMEGFARSQADPDFFKVLDVARRIAGTGSLGLERYAILVQGKGSPDGNYLLDLKRSMPSSLAPMLDRVQPRFRSQAHRVVAAQQRMQAVAMAFLHPVMLDDRPCVLRGLQPSEDRVAIDRRSLTPLQLEALLQTLAQLTAWAQLRSSGRDGAATADELIDWARRAKWKPRLLEAAADAAALVRSDAAQFKAAFDAGAFGPVGSGD